jgi:GNAT superfamily N-acetyltransferase
MAAPYDIRPLTPELWPQLEDLFGPVGACAGCWCLWWRLGSAYRKLTREEAKAAFRAVVEAGPPPGVLALREDGVAVGWCQVTPRAALPHLAKARFTRALDAAPVWSLSCFFVRKGWRGRGVMTALLDGAVAWAQSRGATVLEAYPVRTDGERLSNANLYTGSAASFLAAGFVEAGAHAPHRPIVRRALRE